MPQQTSGLYMYTCLRNNYVRGAAIRSIWLPLISFIYDTVFLSIPDSIACSSTNLLWASYYEVTASNMENVSLRETACTQAPGVTARTFYEGYNAIHAIDDHEVQGHAAVSPMNSPVLPENAASSRF